LAPGLEFEEEFEIAAVGAVGGIDAALKGVEMGVEEFGGAGQGMGFIFDELGDVIEAAVPEVGLDAAEAFEEPGIADERRDEGVLLGGGGVEAFEVGLREVLILGGDFADNDGRVGEDAVFQGVETAGSLALAGARSGGIRRIPAIGIDLFLRTHGFRVGIWGAGRWGGAGVSDCGGGE